MQKRIRGLCGVIAAASVLTGMPVMAAELPDAAQVDVQEVRDDEDDKEGFSVLITDITAEMAANYALNHALKFGHDDFTAGVAVKYFSPEGQMLGWTVPYVCNGQPSGYVLLDFTQEDFVSEFAFDAGVVFDGMSDASAASLQPDDEIVIVERSPLYYSCMPVSSLPQTYSYVWQGRIWYTDWNDYEANFFQLGLRDGEYVKSERYLDVAYDPELHFGREYSILKWGRYACPCSVALHIIKQNGLTAGKSDDYIYRWFWEEMDCCPGDDWDADYVENYRNIYNNPDTSYRADSYVIDGVSHRVITGGCSETVLRNALVKWCKEKLGLTRVGYNDGYSIFETTMAQGIATQCPTFLCYSIKYSDIGTVISDDDVDDIAGRADFDRFYDWCDDIVIGEDQDSVCIEKPLLYLYPAQETDVTVTLGSQDDIMVSYPTYDGSWSVKAQPDGILVDSGNRSYNYLYWESDTDSFEPDFSTGFCVKGSDTAAFLEEQLSYMRLSDKEQDDFITYWLPRMQGNPYNLISFQFGNYDEYEGLHISPEPDCLIKVFMAYKPLEEPAEIAPQALPGAERYGFTAVEWGGMEAK